MFRGSHDAVEFSSSQAEAAGAPRQARPQYRARNREERAAAAAPLAQMAPAPGPSTSRCRCTSSAGRKYTGMYLQPQEVASLCLQVEAGCSCPRCGHAGGEGTTGSVRPQGFAWHKARPEVRQRHLSTRMLDRDCGCFKHSHRQGAQELLRHVGDELLVARLPVVQEAARLPPREARPPRALQRLQGARLAAGRVAQRQLLRSATGLY